MAAAWLTIPSARPNEGTVPLWKARGYKIALWRDGEDDPCASVREDGTVLITGQYPGYAKSVNILISLARQMDPDASFFVAGGDDTHPDPDHTPEEIAAQCIEHFGGTFGVMQPTGDRWAEGSIDRICGSPWLGREFCERAYRGNGPLFAGYQHMFADQELLEVATRLNVLWQRRDLIHLHNHFLRVPPGVTDVNYAATPPPHLVKWNTKQHWDESKALFEGRRRAGFPGHEPLTPWEDVNPQWLEVVGRRALSSRETLRATYDLAATALRNGIAGDFVECGVFAGANAAALARAIMDLTPASGRRVHLFDSFQGIPQAGAQDLEYLAAGHKAGLSTCGLEQVRQHMREWEIDPALLVYHPGWFQDTVPVASIERIAVLRLDGDLYESTKVCMQYLYPKVSSGGWVIVDDYALAGCRSAVNEFVSPGPVYFLK